MILNGGLGCRIIMMKMQTVFSPSEQERRDSLSSETRQLCSPLSGELVWLSAKEPSETVCLRLFEKEWTPLTRKGRDSLQFLLAAEGGRLPFLLVYSKHFNCRSLSVLVYKLETTAYHARRMQIHAAATRLSRLIFFSSALRHLHPRSRVC